MGLHADRQQQPKRRKLTVVDVAGFATSTAPAEQRVSTSKVPLCASCHRAFGGRFYQLVQCARCRAATCLICSRVCTACPSSLPPTPALTRSSTPMASPNPSPKRMALALNTSASNANRVASSMVVLPSIVGKRRKQPVWDADEDERPFHLGDDKATKEDSLPGCGRTVCKNCCYENPQSNATTCYDCYGHAYRTPIQDIYYSTVELAAQ